MRLTKVLALSLFLVAIIAIASGCEGEADRSLSINAYSPMDEASDGGKYVMQGVNKVRLGIFEETGDEYKSVKVYQFSDLSGNLELDDMPKSANTPYTFVLEAFGDGTVRDWVECDLASTGGGKTCSTGWTCKPDSKLRQNLCMRDSAEKLIARGVSRPTIYDGDNQTTLDLFFSRVGEVGKLTSSNGDESAMTDKRYGHSAVKLPNGKVLMISGGIWTRNGNSFKNSAELFDPSTNKFEVVYDPTGDVKNPWPLDGWTSRIFHSTSILDDDSLPYDTEYNTSTDDMAYRFLIFGGENRAGVDNSIYLGIWDADKDEVAMSKIQSSNIPALKRHTATYIGDGKVVVIGGQLENGSPSADMYLIDVDKGSVSKLDASLTQGRYDHTATLLPPGVVSEDNPNSDKIKIVVVGGIGLTSGAEITTGNIEVLHIDLNSNKVAVTAFEYEDGGASEAADLVDRAGHMAVPLLPRQNNGRVAPEDAQLSRVFVFGGFRRSLEDQRNSKLYLYNVDTPGMKDIPVAYVTPGGETKADYWNPNSAYSARMNNIQFPSKHPCVYAQWDWMGDGYDTIVLSGGKRNFTMDKDKEYSDWVEMMSFTREEDTWAIAGLDIGPTENDTVASPYFITNTSDDDYKSNLGRWGHTLTRLDTGMVLISGGMQIISSDSPSTANTAVIFNPPAFRNSWGSEFWAVTNYTNRF